jgi:hypothetical protein
MNDGEFRATFRLTGCLDFPREVVQRLTQVRPDTLGQALRVQE